MGLVTTEQTGAESSMGNFRTWRGRRLAWELNHSMENEIFLARAMTKRDGSQTRRELSRAERKTIRLRRKLDAIVAKRNVSR